MCKKRSLCTETLQKIFLFLVDILLHSSGSKSNIMPYKKPPHTGLNRGNQHSPFHQEHVAYISNNLFISFYLLINMFLSLQLQQPLVIIIHIKCSLFLSHQTASHIQYTHKARDYHIISQLQKFGSSQHIFFN